MTHLGAPPPRAETILQCWLIYIGRADDTRTAMNNDVKGGGGEILGNQIQSFIAAEM